MLGFVSKWKRPPDFIIGQPERPYMLRWYLIPRNRWCNLYLHKILRDDDDRALHDHPWVSASLVLAGSGLEHLEHGRQRKLWRGRIVLRGARTAHRLEVLEGPIWTLFLTGPRIREWGFHCPQGWRHWAEFVEPTEHGQTGRGCDD